MYAFGRMMRRLIEEHDTNQATSCGLCVDMLHVRYLRQYVRHVRQGRSCAHTWDAAGTQDSVAAIVSDMWSLYKL